MELLSLFNPPGLVYEMWEFIPTIGLKFDVGSLIKYGSFGLS
jgi:hypothetical protein